MKPPNSRAPSKWAKRLTFTKDKLKALKSVLGVPSAKTCPKKVTVSTTVDFYVQLGGGAEAPITGSIG
jgi:hypothetical protein